MKPYYQDDWATIYHGDCREILPLLPKVDLVLTDPPYGLGKKLQGGTWGTKFGRGLPWDQAAPELFHVLKSANAAIIWGGNYFILPPSRCWLIWHKPDAVETMATIDMAWTSFNKPSKLFKYSIAATNGERGNHPTPKPLALMSWCLVFASESESVIDPFMGSGTTLRAAKDLGRKSIGIELDERYCEIAAKRLSQEVFVFT